MPSCQFFNVNEISYFVELVFYPASDILRRTTGESYITIEEYAWNCEPAWQEPTSINEQIDLVLNKNKESEVTNGNEWKGFTFKSISFEE